MCVCVCVVGNVSQPQNKGSQEKRNVLEWDRGVFQLKVHLGLGVQSPGGGEEDGEGAHTLPGLFSWVPAAWNVLPQSMGPLPSFSWHVPHTPHPGHP